MYDNQVESISVPSSASIHEKNAMKAFASVWQIKTGETAFFQSEEVISFNIIMIVISTITIVIRLRFPLAFCFSLLPKRPVRR